MEWAQYLRGDRWEDYAATARHIHDSEVHLRTFILIDSEVSRRFDTVGKRRLLRQMRLAVGYSASSECGGMTRVRS